MEKIQSSIPLKIISYIIIPMFLLNIVINSFSILFYETSGEIFKENMTYYETEQFASSFLTSIYRTILYYNDTKDNVKGNLEISTNYTEILQEYDAEEMSTKVELHEIDEINYENSGYKNNLYEYLIID